MLLYWDEYRFPFLLCFLFVAHRLFVDYQFFCQISECRRFRQGALRGLLRWRVIGVYLVRLHVAREPGTQHVHHHDINTIFRMLEKNLWRHLNN